MLAKFFYWAAVLIISLALVVALIVFLEAQDGSSVSDGVVLLPI